MIKRKEVGKKEDVTKIQKQTDRERGEGKRKSE